MESKKAKSLAVRFFAAKIGEVDFGKGRQEGEFFGRARVA